MGLITDPWGTPDLKMCACESILPNLIWNERNCKKFCSHPNMGPFKPILASLKSSPCVDVASYALLMSRNNAYVLKP